ncbi:hypothetical protein MSEN_22240 [Mycolicibacter senuensis]|uniref:Uncharacterized protein n=1 Tax=Mycolicibacter senuensis TaxID=386913 RepID=A0A7I9XKQ8_9MYCO|nr:hypothetical protein MSEN_22240 [Mycolicibacter senuensis]
MRSGVMNGSAPLTPMSWSCISAIRLLTSIADIEPESADVNMTAGLLVWPANADGGLTSAREPTAMATRVLRLRLPPRVLASAARRTAMAATSCAIVLACCHYRL